MYIYTDIIKTKHRSLQKSIFKRPLLCLLNAVHSWAGRLSNAKASGRHPRSLTVQQCRGPRPAHFMQSSQSRGRPGNTKCLINLLICCDCRAWKARFLAIWGQENPVPCYLQTHTHLSTQILLPTIWPTFMCGGGNKDRSILDYLHESTTMGQASYWLLTRQS